MSHKSFLAQSSQLLEVAHFRFKWILRLVPAVSPCSFHCIFAATDVPPKREQYLLMEEAEVDRFSAESVVNQKRMWLIWCI